MDKRQRLIRDIEEYGKGAKGRSNLLLFLKGERITQRQAIAAKCYDCCGYCQDGRVECRDTTCPLYLYSPYSPDGISKPEKTHDSSGKTKRSPLSRTKNKLNDKVHHEEDGDS